MWGARMMMRFFKYVQKYSLYFFFIHNHIFKKSTRWHAIIFIVCALFSLGLMSINPAIAGQSPRSQNSLDKAFDFVPRNPLAAHIRFCLIYADQCLVHDDKRDPLRDTQQNFNEALKVNWSVNRAITPKADEEFDSWDVDVEEGDCEDYALQKRKNLIEMGWPSSALRLAITRTPHGTIHAVLLVTISETDFVLDNLTSRILTWNETSYEFLMIQDKDDPTAWHDVVFRDVLG